MFLLKLWFLSFALNVAACVCVFQAGLDITSSVIVHDLWGVLYF